MSTYTPKLNLIKPDPQDFVDIGQLNQNSDIIDRYLGDVMSYNRAVPLYQVVDNRATSVSFSVLRSFNPLGGDTGQRTLVSDKFTIDGSFEMAAPMNMFRYNSDSGPRDVYRAYLGNRLVIYDIITVGGSSLYIPYSGFNETLANSDTNATRPRNCNVNIYSSLIWSELNGVRTPAVENPVLYAAYSGGGIADTPTTKSVTASNGAVWTSVPGLNRIDVCGTLRLPLVVNPNDDTAYCHRLYFYNWDNMATSTGNGRHWPVFSYYKIGQLNYMGPSGGDRKIPIIREYIKS